MSDKTIDLDFYIPVKDGEKYIATCVESVLNQTLLPRQVTVYYNIHSTDRTREILSRYPVRVVDVDFPLSDARNFALKDLTGEWIGCCDADVVLSPEWVERLWEKRDSGAAILSGNTQERVQTVGDLYRSLMSPHNWGEHDVINPYMLVPDMLVKRQRLIDMNGYKTGWVNYEDSDMALRLKAAGDFFYYVALARATHHHEDDFVSCLDLRWRHSFRRQEKLLMGELGLRRKLLNNLALATVAYTKANNLKHQELMQVVFLMPLHHFLADVEYFSRQNDLTLMSRPQEQEILKGLNDLTSHLIGPRAKSFQEKFAAVSQSLLAAEFLTEYVTFLRVGVQGLKFEWDSGVSHFPESLDCVPLSRHLGLEAIAVEKWEDMERVVVANTREHFSHNPRVIFDFANDPRPDVTGYDCGLAQFRQKIFPVQHDVFTCRDITEYLASRGMKLYWTETFQGSTLISFGPEFHPAAHKESKTCVSL